MSTRCIEVLETSAHSRVSSLSMLADTIVLGASIRQNSLASEEILIQIAVSVPADEVTFIERTVWLVSPGEELADGTRDAQCLGILLPRLGPPVVVFVETQTQALARPSNRRK
jgi:hypothetical protein